jgi:hypothetical protein
MALAVGNLSTAERGALAKASERIEFGRESGAIATDPTAEKKPNPYVLMFLATSICGIALVFWVESTSNSAPATIGVLIAAGTITGTVFLFPVGAIIVKAMSMADAKAKQGTKNSSKKPPKIPTHAQLLKYLVRQGWQLPPTETRLPSPPHLRADYGLLPLAYRSTEWGSVCYVEFTRSWDFGQQTDEAHLPTETFRGILGTIDPAKVAPPTVNPTSDRMTLDPASASQTSVVPAIVNPIEFTEFDLGGYIHLQPEPYGTDMADDLDFESPQFNDSYRVDSSSDAYAREILSPAAIALLLETFDYPDDLLDASLPAQHPRFEYHIESGSIVVFRYHQPDNPIWTITDDFVFTEAQFRRFFKTLPGIIRG